MRSKTTQTQQLAGLVAFVLKAALTIFVGYVALCIWIVVG